MSRRAAQQRRTCRWCGCTDERACEGGCAWVGDSNICSRCDADHQVVAATAIVFRVLAGLRPGARRHVLEQLHEYSAEELERGH